MTTKGTLKHKTEDVSIPGVIRGNAEYANFFQVKFAEADRWYVMEKSNWEFMPDAPNLVETIKALKNGTQFRYVTPGGWCSYAIYTKLSDTHVALHYAHTDDLVSTTSIYSEFVVVHGSIEVIE